MEGHRVRLNDREVLLIVSALKARESGVSDATALEIRRLAERLTEMVPGNPRWILGWRD